MQQIPFLTLITFLPILGMFIILALPRNSEKLIKVVTLAVTSIQVILAGVIWSLYNYTLGGVNTQASFQFVERFTWIDVEGISWLGRIKVDYFLGIDGLSAPMVFLTAIVVFIATLSSWNIKDSVKGYFALFLLLNTGIMGV